MAENSNSKEEVAVTITEGGGGGGGATTDQATTTTMTSKTIDPVKNLNGLIAILSFILSIPVLAAVIWLLYMRDYDCEDLLRLPKLQIGISIGLIFVFIISNGVVYVRSRFPIPGLLIVMVPLIFMFTMGLGLVGAYKMESRAIPATPMWLKFKVHNEKNWNNIKSCIYDTNVCDDLVSKSLTLKSYDFSMRKLSSIESGCCKPPESCEMEYVNATFWRKQEDGGGGAVDNKSKRPYDSDCDRWSNDENMLCYNCFSCKEGYLRTLESKWWKLGCFLTVMASLLICSHILLFCFTMLESFGGV